jgi:hypothetical protein
MTDPAHTWESLVQRPIGSAEAHTIDILWPDYPPDVVSQAIERAFADTVKPERRHLARLSWIQWEVTDALRAWRRAVGPSYGQSAPTEAVGPS